MTQDPIPLLADPNESDAVRRLLKEEAQLPIPTGTDAAILAKLTDAGVVATAHAPHALWLKSLAAIGSGVLVVFVASRLLVPNTSTSLPIVSPPAIATPSVHESAPADVSAIAVPDQPPQPKVRVAPSAPPHADLRSEGDLRREAALLRSARSALRAGDPIAALATLATHAKEFPRGMLAQERAVLEIEARSAVGQADQARTQSERFIREHPESPHAKRLQEGELTKEGGASDRK